jgi:hydroxyacylglutathione hydrolase
MKIWQTKSGYKISCILPGRSNVFLLTGFNKNILVDTSPGYKWNKLKAVLNNMRIKSIDFLVLTHTHYDHAENASKVKSEYGAKVIVNIREASFLGKGETTLPAGTVPLTRFLVNRIVPLLSVKLNYPPCQPDILVDEKLDLGFNVFIIHTPGHSPGSQSVIIDDEIALAGDAMFGVFPGSIFPPFANNKDELITSWAKLLDTNCHLFLPSHGTGNNRDLVQREFLKRSKS